MTFIISVLEYECHRLHIQNMSLDIIASDGLDLFLSYRVWMTAWYINGINIMSTFDIVYIDSKSVPAKRLEQKLEGDDDYRVTLFAVWSW